MYTKEWREKNENGSSAQNARCWYDSGVNRTGGCNSG